MALTPRPAIQERTDERRTAWPPGGFELTCGPTPFERGGMDPRTPPDPACLRICDRMTSLAGSTVAELERTDPPVIEIELQGGFAYIEGSTRVWSDGTVRYHGSHCRTLQGRRATLAPARVAELLAAIERGGFFDDHGNDAIQCSDAIHGTVAVRGAGKSNSLAFNDCSDTALSTFVGDLQKAIGTNPCLR
jgi:hypothetical protein